jgi:hypothetical protein
VSCIHAVNLSATKKCIIEISSTSKFASLCIKLSAALSQLQYCRGILQDHTLPSRITLHHRLPCTVTHKFSYHMELRFMWAVRNFRVWNRREQFQIIMAYAYVTLQAVFPIASVESIIHTTDTLFKYVGTLRGDVSPGRAITFLHRLLVSGIYILHTQ